MSVFRVFLVRIIPHSDWTRRQTEREKEWDSIFPYSVQIRENTDQKNFECGHFSSSEHFRTFTLNTFSFEQIIELIYWWCNYVMIQVSLTRLSFERCFARWWEKHPSNLRLIKSTCSWWVNFFFMNTEQISENIFT